MNWGTKIIIVLAIFIFGIGSMVYVCMKQNDIQLVRKDYYEQEIAYQNVIDKENNYRALVSKPQLTDNLVENAVIIDFSQSENYNKLTGMVYFFRPSQSKMDFRTKMELNEDGLQLIDKTNIGKGKWLIKLDWSDGTKEYYNEQTIFIQ